MPGTPKGTPKSRSGASTPTGPSGTGSGALSKHKRRRQERKRQTDAVIDLTNDDAEEAGDEHLKRDVAKFYEGLRESSAGPSGSSRKREELEDGEIAEEPISTRKPKSKKGKERAVETVEPTADPVVPESKTEEPVQSVFKPLSRSILSGWQLSPSPSPSPPPHKRSRTESPSQVEIFIDEKPSSDVPSPVHKDGESSHFEPPGLFSTALVPSKRAKRTLRKEEEKKQQDGQANKEDGSDEDAKEQVGKLLLPEHVFIEAATDGTSEEVDERRPIVSEEGLHVFDDSQAKGVTRYFDPQIGTDEASTFLATADQSRICMNCKRPGHNQRDCPHVICPTCGKEDEHERRDCPYNLICFRCGLAGHKIQDCSKPRTKGGACDRCGSYDHTAVVCPTLWRMYSYYTASEREAAQSEADSLTGWAKEAAGGDEGDRHCYNCARRDHFGDDCPRSRGSLARYAPSAFNKLSLSLGPFSARSNAPIPPRPTHQRWDSEDDRDRHADRLPGQVTPFAGLNAGKKTIEKRKRAAMEQERQFGGSEPRRPRDRDRDRDRKDGTLPFGHSHFMTPAASPAARGKNGGQSPSQIQFGKLSLPGSDDQNGTPRRNGGPGPSNSASTTLVNRALRQSYVNSPKTPTVNLNSRSSSPLASTPNASSSSLKSSSKSQSQSAKSKERRRKRKSGDSEMEEGEIEEIAFRKSGAGGGKVTDWGREMDEEERKAKKVAAGEKKRGKKSSSKNGGGAGADSVNGPGGGGGGGLSIKGRNKAVAGAPGQRYHGGY